MAAKKPKRAPELLEPGDYERLLADQGGVCAICGKPPKAGGRRLNVDHDHRTGAVRGLLCWTCNHFILGKYATAAKLLSAARYLGVELELVRETFPELGPTPTP